ncbi:riboflavin synthase [Alienimonas californiensis]|uniref:Riboflavin synthase n=1 Tax=Alienimonas californiensis TaxID=2527989 RepID=A0A517P5M3_9PLAN|nr:riboflavin synthase [Alienimonas californiensis]QDT14661.1 Riboflavin synthase [Alienimonas californiensis]
MFTGLVEAKAVVHRLDERGSDVRLTLAVPPANGRGEPLAGDVKLGDSVALNGCCLTVVEIAGPAGELWSFEAGAETLSRTNLGELSEGRGVNVERALRAGDRLGGHLVQGHVDAVGTVAKLDRDGEWLNMHFTAPANVAELLVDKGSVCVDGVSLTVCEPHLGPDGDGGFYVALIPHTLHETTLGDRSVGDRVNFEADVLGKYVQKLLAPHLARAGR